MMENTLVGQFEPTVTRYKILNSTFEEMTLAADVVLVPNDPEVKFDVQLFVHLREHGVFYSYRERIAELERFSSTATLHPDSNELFILGPNWVAAALLQTGQLQVEGSVGSTFSNGEMIVFEYMCQEDLYALMVRGEHYLVKIEPTTNVSLESVHQGPLPMAVQAPVLPVESLDSSVGSVLTPDPGRFESHLVAALRTDLLRKGAIESSDNALWLAELVVLCCANALTAEGQMVRTLPTERGGVIVSLCDGPCDTFSRNGYEIHDAQLDWIGLAGSQSARYPGCTQSPMEKAMALDGWVGAIEVDLTLFHQIEVTQICNAPNPFTLLGIAYFQGGHRHYVYFDLATGHLLASVFDEQEFLVIPARRF